MHPPPAPALTASAAAGELNADQARANRVIYHASCRHDRRTSQPLCLVLASIVRYLHAAQNQAMVLYWKNGLSRLQKRHPFIFFPLKLQLSFSYTSVAALTEAIVICSSLKATLQPERKWGKQVDGGDNCEVSARIL